MDSSSSTTAPTGSLPIRAPLTADSDSEYETGSTVGGSSLNSFDNNSEEGYESEEFLSGEEFENGGKVEEDNGVSQNLKIYVANKDANGDIDGLENSTDDEVVLEDGSNSKPSVPIAQLSRDDEEFAEVLSDEEIVTEVEDGGFSGVVKVPGAVESSPRIKVALGVEEKEESLGLRNSAVVVAESENGGMEDSVEPGSEGGKNDTVMEISKLDEDAKDSPVKMEIIDEGRIESRHGDEDDNVNEEKSLVMGNDANHASRPVLESGNVDVIESGAVDQGSETKIDSRAELDESNDHDIMIADAENDDLSRTSDGDREVDELRNDTAPVSVSELNPEAEDIANDVSEKVLLSDEDLVQLIFGSSETTKHVLSEAEHGMNPTSLLKVDSEDQLETAHQQIAIDSADEAEAEGEHDIKELFDSAALAALLKAAAGAESDGGGITVTSTDGSRVFSLERPARSGSSFHPSRVAPASHTVHDVSKDNISDEEKKRLEKLQLIRVKFLRLVKRLGHSPTDPMVAQVLYRLALAFGSLSSQEFTLESARIAAMQLEDEGKDDLDFSLNIVVLGKTGVGKSASINSIFREQKSRIDAFEPATTAVKEIVGTVDGVKMRIFDTPGLKSPMTEEATNRKLLASIKRFVRKFPPDVVLYVDRLDTHERDLTDFLLLKSLTDILGSSIWQNAIVTLTHATSASPNGALGEPLSYEVFVAQRSHVVHRAISQAVGDLRLMNPSMMNPVALVENHPSCERDRNGESLLPNGQSWRSQLLLLCYSVKILSEATSLSKSQGQYDHQKLFGFRLRSPPLPYLLSSLLQSRPHPKLPTDQGGEDLDLDMELGDSASSDEDEYDQLPPFKPLKKSQVAKLSKEQRKAYYEEYDYRVKLLQKKQWREEVKRVREIKKKGKEADNNLAYVGDADEDVEEAEPATLSVPLPDMVLPPSFDGDNPTYRYRFLDTASDIVMRPVLDSQVWDHDIGYDGVSLERSLAIAGYLPGAFAVQLTKDKTEFNIHFDSSVCAKHGENISTMAGFDIQNVGKQLAYIFRAETKFKNIKVNQTTAGLSVTFLGENVATGLKIEDQIAVGKRLVLAGSAGAMTSQGEAAYGANMEIRLKDKDFPIEQNQTTLGLSLVKWRRDLGLMANLQSQFSIGRGSSMAVRVGLNNKQSGQINLKVSSSDQLHIALASLLPIAASILRMIYPGSVSKSSPY
ncbi:Translocon at the outer envelope membrane of chloroplast [Corchorus olitorius]|uniref:Translocon at the outer envelope membrane of chloroplast n=1 Tax=Corchorus olitorius TaxID=93759 RepID=A0A1R3JUG8_9ROSI|nr:Translocon at the outer envelope membrane of chloroplast [Corchorus olitorius]